jgi:hypothetical protein
MIYGTLSLTAGTEVFTEAVNIDEMTSGIAIRRVFFVAKNALCHAASEGD